MQKKWRKVFALSLALIFLALNIVAEFSHDHHADDNLNITSASQKDGLNSQSHSLVCIACLFGVTQLAPALSCQIFKRIEDSFLAPHKDSLFYSIDLPTSYFLRAPPAKFI